MPISNIFETHSLHLLPVAGLIAVVGGLVAIVLFQYARRSAGLARLGWIFLTGVATGTMVWTTHFVAMLAYDPGCTTAYDPLLTSVSFFMAILAATAGVGIATGSGLACAITGGAILGLGIAAMHYTGMAALHVAGGVAWNPIIIGASVLAGVLLSILAILRLYEQEEIVFDWPAALTLALAVCSLHFLGMAALVVTPDAGLALAPLELGDAALSYIVTTLALMVTATGFATILITRQANSNLRDLANAAVEGLVLTDGGTILDLNQSFSDLAGLSMSNLKGMSLENLLVPPEPAGGWCEARRTETDLVGFNGRIPVEVIVRPLPARGRRMSLLAVRDLRERRAAEEQIRYLAHFDTLTGLPNRTLFKERMAQVLAEAGKVGGEVAVMVLDLDHFKEVNDVYGHAAGDALLKSVTERLRANCTGADFIARIGGDEFVILQSGLAQPGAAARLASFLPLAFREPFAVAERQIEAGLTVGVALYPRDGETSEQLLANADLALYRAKQEGRGTASFFTPEMDEVVRSRRVLAKDLRLAVEEEKLELHFQPQVSLGTEDVVGFEALARWRHPRKGDISPADFVPIAEETDLIFALGEWVMRTACTEAASWAKPCRIAVNLSPVQFREPALPQKIADILLRTRLDPRRLEIEVTESTLIRDFDRVSQILGEIRNLGVRIALDDFGTGFSSLSTLQSFPFDKIKIDKSFVGQIGRGEDSTVIVNAILGLGRSLSIPVMAEGVETEAQRQFLRSALCAEAQGWMFGRAAPIGNFDHIVRPGQPFRATG